MAEFDIESGSNGICNTLIENNKDIIQDLIDEQIRTSTEAWTVGAETISGFSFSGIKSGKKAEIKDEKIADAIDDLNMDGVRRIISIHTHPHSEFLSPSDIETHVRFSREWQNYTATAVVHGDKTNIEVFAAENEDFIYRRADIVSMLQQYQFKLEDSVKPSKYYAVASEMFDDMGEFMDFCHKEVSLNG